MSKDKQTVLSYITIVLLAVIIVMLGGIFCNVKGWCNPSKKGFFCPLEKKQADNICPFPNKRSGSNSAVQLKGSSPQ